METRGGRQPPRLRARHAGQRLTFLPHLSSRQPMGTATLTIDLDAIVANWRALDAATGQGTETGAVVKADAYGLGAARVARALARAGARTFFVAVAEEGAAVRTAARPRTRHPRLLGPHGRRYRHHRPAPAHADAELPRPAHPPFRGAARPPLRRPARHRHEPARDGARRMGRRARHRAPRRAPPRDEPPRLRGRTRASR